MLTAGYTAVPSSRCCPFHHISQSFAGTYQDLCGSGLVW